MAESLPGEAPPPEEEPPKLEEEGTIGHVDVGSAADPSSTSIADESLAPGTTSNGDIKKAGPSEIPNSGETGSVSTQPSRLQESTAAPGPDEGTTTPNPEKGANSEINGTPQKAGPDLPRFASASIVKRLRQNLSLVGSTSSRLDERGGAEYREKKELERRIAELEEKNEELKDDKQQLNSYISLLEQVVDDANTALENLNVHLQGQMDRS
ncbi:hypothetical protein BJY00DRAFT_294755 [Aspergillus carlsbadensis]|nr:hypothetical protein BJY00DRAFT_294755 [Aspergillus carlsbadensis]